MPKNSSVLDGIYTSHIKEKRSKFGDKNRGSEDLLVLKENRIYPKKIHMACV